MFSRVATTHFSIFCKLTVSKTKTEQNFELARGKQLFSY